MHSQRTIEVEGPATTSLVARAIAAGAPEFVAAEALRATRTRFPGRAKEGMPLSSRAEAYFWGVIRRRALQGAAPAVSRRIVIASLERELREAGHTPEAIRRELVRLHGADALSINEPLPGPIRAFA